MPSLAVASVVYAGVTYYSSFSGKTAEYYESRVSYTAHVNPGIQYMHRVQTRSWYSTAGGTNPCKENKYRVVYYATGTGNMPFSIYNGSVNISLHEFFRHIPYNEYGAFYSSADNNTHANSTRFEYGYSGSSCGSAIVPG